MKKARGSWAAVRRGIGNEIAITKDRLRAVFCLCLGRSPSRRHRTMTRLLRTVVDEISPVLLERLAWNRTCQLAPSVRLRLPQAPSKLIFGNVRVFESQRGSRK